MTILIAETTFNILASSSYTEEETLLLLPENDGVNVLRELHYPAGNAIQLPPIVYTQNPDKYENFDSTPLTARPIVQSDQTIGGNTVARWQGYLGDAPIIERWIGDDTRSKMYTYFLRRLWEYFVNPPAIGYITWYPKDRTSAIYNIEIENLTAGGQQISFDYIAARGQFVMGEVVFSFRIISEV